MTNTGIQKVKSSITGSTDVFRSVSNSELTNIKSTGNFNLPVGGMEAKQFAFSYSEVAQFGQKFGQSSIVRASIPNRLLQSFDVTSVDTFLFKSGTVTVWGNQIGQFNQAVSASIKIIP